MCYEGTCTCYVGTFMLHCQTSCFTKLKLTNSFKGIKITYLTTKYGALVPITLGLMDLFCENN